MDDQEDAPDTGAPEQAEPRDVATELCGACAPAPARPKTDASTTTITVQIHPGRDLVELAVLAPLTFVVFFAAVFTVVSRRRRSAQ
jgi:hypothetical protein